MNITPVVDDERMPDMEDDDDWDPDWDTLDPDEPDDE